jgi:crossover junction endodeoxyribonuclease RuvC
VWVTDPSQPDGVGVIDMPAPKVKKAGTKKQFSRVDAPLLAAALRKIPHPIQHAVLERVSSRPGEGVSSVFAFGRAAGICEGVLAGLDLPVQLVVPQVWRRAMVPATLDNTKKSSRAAAARLLPKHAHLFKRVKDDGRADAALMALYGALHL